jgi:hypothetical protein
MTTTEKPMRVRQVQYLRAQAEGLLRLAELIEDTPEINATYVRPEERIEINAWHAPSPDQMAAIARAALAHGAKIEKDASAEIYTLTVSWNGFAAKAIAARESVCERIVTGTETVKRTVPDPAAALVEVTETVEHVEWVCRPLLATESGKDTGK